tara:strand:- start:12 stop:824 length:813 start_codon:yes stop_codon:yes gene_type:complete
MSEQAQEKTAASAEKPAAEAPAKAAAPTAKPVEKKSATATTDSPASVRRAAASQATAAKAAAEPAPEAPAAKAAPKAAPKAKASAKPKAKPAAKAVAKPAAAKKAAPKKKAAPAKSRVTKAKASKPVSKPSVSAKKAATNPFATLKGLPVMNASVMGNLEDFQSMGKDNVDAMVQSSKILTKGMEDLTRAFFDLAQNSVEQSVAVSQAMLKAKTLKEVTDMQNDLVKKSFDQFVAEGTKLSELSVKVANDAAEPLTSRMNEVASRFSASA